jgi:hypothetical protein
MWSFTEPIWEAVFRWATISALAFGGIGVVSAFVSAWVGYEITDATQKEADKQIAEAKARGDEARAVAAQATERTAVIEAENVRLAAQIAPRRLTTEQQIALGRLLVMLAGRTVRFESYGLDAESAILGKQVENAFSLAEAKVDEALMTRASGGQILFGIHVTSGDKPTIGLIVGALQSVGLAATDGTNSQQGVSVRFNVTMPTVRPDAIVFVGVKPIAH